MLQNLDNETIPDPATEPAESNPADSQQQQPEGHSGQAGEADSVDQQLALARENLRESDSALRHLPVGSDYIQIERRYLPVARRLARLDAERQRTPEYELYRLAKIQHSQADDQLGAAEEQAQSDPDYRQTEKYRAIAEREWQTRSRLHRTRHQLDLTPAGGAYRRSQTRSRMLVAEFDRIQDQVRETAEWQDYIQAGQLVESLEQKAQRLEASQPEIVSRPETDLEAEILPRAA